MTRRSVIIIIKGLYYLNGPGWERIGTVLGECWENDFFLKNGQKNKTSRTWQEACSENLVSVYEEFRNIKLYVLRLGFHTDITALKNATADLLFTIDLCDVLAVIGRGLNKDGRFS